MMISVLMDYYHWFAEILKTNQIVAGMFSLWGITVITFLFVKTPSKIFNFATKQFTTSIVFNNEESYDQYSNYSRFNAWFVTTKWAKFSRSLSLYSYYGDKGQTTVFGPGFGFHFFFYNYSLYWFRKEKIITNGSTYKQREEIILSTFSRNQDKLYKIIDLFKDSDSENFVSIFIFEDSWTRLTKISKKNLNSVIINKNTKNKIIDDIKFFINNEDWYRNSPLPYKLTFLIHGKPGGGKSSFVKALASEFGKDIYIINFSTISDKGLVKALSTVPPNSIILSEDVHSVDELIIKENNNDKFCGITSTLTLSGILNAFGGIIPLDGVITFFTTNYINKLEPAFYRKGRCDYIVEFPELENDEINEYIETIFPNNKYEHRNDYKPIMGCDLESIFVENKFDIKLFVDSIPKLSD